LSTVSTELGGYQLPLHLLLGFRVLIDGLHAELARQGHPGIRPVHGFILQAVGTDGVTAAELGRRLGVTKQAATKHIERLEHLGYLHRAAHPRDGRQKVVRRTGAGLDVLRRSAAIFDELRDGWMAILGEDRLTALEQDLRKVTAGQLVRVDAPGWFSGE
jgi:DNA-binding MarR family transcriptional regulator